ncbi:MAG: hypothetical protein K0R17_2348 [Rariglobus sp.]|jgi:hypothetical protein|nr:hypothetical protein [Rariglobus sp.]
MNPRFCSFVLALAVTAPLSAAHPAKSPHTPRAPFAGCTGAHCSVACEPAHRTTFWSKDTNLVIINRVKDATGTPRLMTGIYASPASCCGTNARTDQIDWGRNLLEKPVAPGNYAALYIDTAVPAGFNLRIDFEGTDASGKPLQYFHTGAVLYKKGVIVHQAIRQLKDGSSPWTIDRVIDKNFAR